MKVFVVHVHVYRNNAIHGCWHCQLSWTLLQLLKSCWQHLSLSETSRYGAGNHTGAVLAENNHAKNTMILVISFLSFLEIAVPLK